jgi:hypothetical protein
MFEKLRQCSIVYGATAPADPLKSMERQTVITPALLGSDAGLYGAARVSMLSG